MSVIRWEEPTNARRNIFDEKWRATAEELRSRPGDWGVIVESGYSEATGLVSAIKRGKGPFAPAGAFDAASRTVTDARGSKVVRAYARYVGGETP